MAGGQAESRNSWVAVYVSDMKEISIQTSLQSGRGCTQVKQCQPLTTRWQ